jgi:MFS family permease
MSETTAASRTWAPLAVPAFRALWLAQLVSNTGTWMQTVGAQWLLVHNPNAAALTAMAQAASLLPVLFISLPAGVLADVLDRRRYLIATQVAAIGVVTLLAVLTAVGEASPTVVLLLTFALGITTALASPAWQAIQPQLVPRELIPGAAGLGSMNINIARAIGPAVAGLIIASTSPAVVFAFNAVSTVFVVVALLRWRAPRHGSGNPERLVPALRAGSRYVANAPVVRRVLLRSALFVLPASALWALLAVVASDRLGLGSGGYGLLLGALGLGAVIGALLLGRIRARLGPNRLLAVFSLLYAVGMLGAALLPSALAVMILLLASGIGWVVLLSTFNTTLQLTLAGWVRARGLSTYLIVFLGGQGLGALLWGTVGQAIGVPEALLAASGILVLSVVTLLWWRMPTGSYDRSVTPWPDPEIDVAPDEEDGPVVVEVAYTVTGDPAEFLRSAQAVGVSRRRTGASSWAMYRDLADHTSYVEVFTVPTWGEHLRQHYERITGYDHELEQRLRTFDVNASEPGDTLPRHLIAVEGPG